jgi:hypothetical protein
MYLHFAQLDLNNVVLKVIAVADDIQISSDGELLKDNPKHVEGEIYATTFGPGPWKQAFKDGTRKQFPSAGHTYDSTNDVFIEPKPFESWTLDSSYDWQPPIVKPTTPDDALYDVLWDEDNERWIAQGCDSSIITKIWNPNTSSWS